MSQLNNNNFFRWFTGEVVEEQSITLPRVGIQDKKFYLPQLVKGEQTGFFINSDIPFYDGDILTDLELRFTDGTNETVVGAVIQSVILEVGYRLYAEFTFPDVLPGQYQYFIYNTSTLTTKCISNFFQVIDSTDADLYTCTVQWRNSRDAFYYNWSVIPDFYCRLRLNLSLSNYGSEGSIDQTKAVSTGMRRNNNYDLDFYVKLQTYYFDDGANRACEPLFSASELIINGRNYINKGLYVPNIRVNSKVAIGEIDLYDQPYSRINKYGQLPQLVIKQGKYVLVNDTPIDFTINFYSAEDLLIGSQVVPSGATFAVKAADLQINSYLNIVASANSSISAITVHSMPDGTFQFSDITITTMAPSLRVGQNQVYGNDWLVVLTTCIPYTTTSTTTSSTTTSSTTTSTTTSSTTTSSTTTSTTTLPPGYFLVLSQNPFNTTILSIFDGTATGIPSAFNSLNLPPGGNTAGVYANMTAGTIHVICTPNGSGIPARTELYLKVGGIIVDVAPISNSTGNYVLTFVNPVASPTFIEIGLQSY